MAYTTDDIIQWGKISQPYAAIGEAKKRATVGSTVDTDLHIKLYVERKTVEWYNDQTTQDADILYQISNWLFALEGIYGLKAQFVDTGNGGQVVPVSPSSGRIPSPLDFIVTATDTTILAGETSVTLSQFIGYDVEFDRGGQPQYTTNPGDGSSYFSWDIDTGLFTIYPAASIGEPFRIVPVGGIGSNIAGSNAQRAPIFVIVGISANAPTASTSTWQNSDFINAYVTLFLNGVPVATVDPGTGVPYITKSFNSDTITITNYTWSANDQLLAMIILP